MSQVAQGKDINAEVRAVDCGAAPGSFTSGTGVGLAALNIESQAVRPNSAGILFTITGSVAATKSLSCVTKLQTSLDGTNWTDVPDTSETHAWSVGSGGATLTVRKAVLVGTDVIRDGAKHLRVHFTPTFTDAPTAPTLLGITALLSGLDVR